MNALINASPCSRNGLNGPMFVNYSASRSTHKQRAEAKKAEIQNTYQQTGKFAGEVIKGKQTYLSIEEITSHRPSSNWMKIYSKLDFENKIQDIKMHKSAAVQQLFAKMCFISLEELKILKQMYDELSITDTEIAVIIDTLMIKAGISF